MGVSFRGPSSLARRRGQAYTFRSAGDALSYPDDDVVAVCGSDGKWRYTKKVGTPY
jgi:hypothetical protein